MESRPDAYGAGIKDGAAGIQIDAAAEPDVDAIGAVERRFDEDVVGNLGKKRSKVWRHAAAFARMHGVVRMDGNAGSAAYSVKLGIKAGIPFSRRHLVALAHAHRQHPAETRTEGLSKATPPWPGCAAHKA